MSKWAYIRVSALTQEKNTSLGTQRERVEHEGVAPENVVEEVASAATIAKRPKLVKLLDSLKKGDVLLVTSMDRFSRKILDTIFAISKIDAKGAYFRSLDFPQISNWQNAQDIFQTVIFAFLAKVELENRAKRVQAGIDRAKQIPGKYVGRKSKVTPQLLRRVKDYETKGLASSEICSLLKIGKSTFYKAKSHLADENQVEAEE